MKIKNMIIGGMLTTIVSVNTAWAVDTATAKKICMKHDEKVWVDKDSVCVPKNPCQDEKYSRYCNKNFEGIQVSSIADGQDIAEAFSGKRWGKSGCLATSQPETGSVGQDYVFCKYTDGEQRVLESDELSESDKYR